MPLGALAVHQLRYWLAYGPRANAELTAQGHSYLSSLVPWTILALGIGATLFVRRLAAALQTGETGRMTRLSAAALWAMAAAALVLIYATQETLEGAFASTHPAGMTGVLGNGGWWAIPASAVVAALIVLVLRVARAALHAAARIARPRHLPLRSLPAPAEAAIAVLRPLARAAAGRAPPLLPLPR
jgi:hypothetical protein